MFVQQLESSITCVLIYVDDIIVIGSCIEVITTVTQKLNSAFVLKDKRELHYFLGIQVNKTNDRGLMMSQDKYVQDLLAKVSMSNCKSCATPLSSTLRIYATGGAMFDNPHLYHFVVGSLQYLTMTKPDLAYSVNNLAQFIQKL
ncbi:uncharacterized mitochondrial protein AtMg00810-like [Arachis duranensis]|uniref:Uncharacterized mitochondrial protein AtMg00810-like n=1 Tax=Arachis duranensis TaxID=130453 RepID=A0A6P4BVZ0_ARADU|nr:uncharacterized mitochondrial protein AtMg00810-like [Arachis duranensis]